MGVYEDREDGEGADHILASSHKRKEGWCGKIEEKKVNQKSKPKKKNPRPCFSLPMIRLVQNLMLNSSLL